MCRYVARCRVERGGLEQVQVAVVRSSHEPGAEVEVDFGEFHAMIAGVLVKLWLFVLRLSCLQAGAFHVAPATQAQEEAFLEGTCWRWSTLAACGAPAGSGGSNLKQAVVRWVLRGRDRAESERFHRAAQPLRRFGFSFCAPGHEGAHTRRAGWKARSAEVPPPPSGPGPRPSASLAAR